MDFLRTFPGTIPCLRNRALIRAGLWPLNSPVMVWPLLSRPSQVYTLIFAALTAIAQSLVTGLIASRRVPPPAVQALGS
ncbi:hypothetical protein D3C76_1835060 [compost metagenome]